MRCFHRLQFNCGARAERKVGQIMGGRGNCPTTVVDVQHVLVNSDIGIFRIHFWQALC